MSSKRSKEPVVLHLIVTAHGAWSESFMFGRIQNEFTLSIELEVHQSFWDLKEPLKYVKLESNLREEYLKPLIIVKLLS